jgi:uncharacterized protein (DUF849 family)
MAKKKRPKKKPNALKNTIPRNRKAELYAFWLSVPGIMKQKKNAYFKELVKNSKFKDEEIEKIINANTTTEIAEALDTSRMQLARWGKMDWVKKKVDYFNKFNNVMRFKKDIDYSFTQATIKSADAARVKLWKQLYEGWVEKSSNLHEFDEENIVGIQNQLKSLAENKNVETYNVDELKKEINGTKLLKENNGNVWADESGHRESEDDSEDFILESSERTVRDDR